MNNKMVGIVILIIGGVLALLMVQLTGSLYTEAEILGCYQNHECVQIESKINATHFVFGILGFVLALGFYLLTFSKTEQALLKRIETHEEKIKEKEKFELILKGLDKDERSIMKIVKEEEGITQSTLRLRSGLSKAKLSYVLSSLEKKELILREKKGKSLAIFLK